MNPIDLTTLKDGSSPTRGLHLSGGRVGFTSEDDKLKARQTREGIHKSELSNDQKLVLL